MGVSTTHLQLNSLGSSTLSLHCKLEYNYVSKGIHTRDEGHLG